MGHLPHWSPQHRQHIGPWVRRRTRRWVRADNVAHAGMLFAAIPSLPRAELSRLTERMIDRMDEIDGDADFEADGDELDGSMGEDDFHHQSANWLGYPGDPDDAEDSHDQEMEDAHA
jgi:hypothetical protein